MHINIEYSTIAAIEDMIEMFVELDEVQITEFDMSLSTSDYQSYDEIPDILLRKQGYRYEELFDVFKHYGERIGTVTFLGMVDIRYSPQDLRIIAVFHPHLDTDLQN